PSRNPWRPLRVKKYFDPDKRSKESRDIELQYQVRDDSRRFRAILFPAGNFFLFLYHSEVLLTKYTKILFSIKFLVIGNEFSEILSHILIVCPQIFHLHLCY